jgi:uncharacterized membrane protein
MRLYDCTGGLVLLEMKREAEEQRLRELRQRHRRIVDKHRQRRHRAKVKRESLALELSNGFVLKPIK